jgi:hypothetical protein
VSAAGVPQAPAAAASPEVLARTLPRALHRAEEGRTLGRTEAAALFGARDGGAEVPVATVEAMVEAGLAGVEARHPAHDRAASDRWTAIATRFGPEVTDDRRYTNAALATSGWPTE